MKDQKKAIIYALIACIVWGTVYVAIKVGLDHGLKPISFAGLRFLAGGLILLAFAAAMGRFRFSLKDLWLLALLGILQTALQNALFFKGVQLTNAGISAIFINTAPFFVILLAPLFFHGSRITTARVLGAAIGFGGVYLASYRPGILKGDYELGILLLVSSAITWAFSNIAAKKIMQTRDALTVTGMQMLLGSIPLIAAGAAMEGKFLSEVDPIGCVSLIYLIVFATSIPFLAWYKALKLGEVGQVSIFGFTLPILGVVSGWLLLGEPMNGHILAGMVMVAFGIIIVNI